MVQSFNSPNITYMGGLIYAQENNFTWGLQSLDRRFGKPSIRELIIMFGYSGIGKTEYSYFVARRNSEEGNLVQYFSLELPEYDMKQRICLSRAGVSKYEFQTNQYRPEQKAIMDKTWDDIDNLHNLKIISPPNKTVENLIESMIEGYNNGCKMFVIDNLDKVQIRNGGDNENTRYQSITSQLQDFKNKFDVCIILIHHAKKVMNKQQAMMKAGLEGLRGSQKIIDNSTQIFEVYRDLDPDGNDYAENISEIIQLKDTFGGPKGYEKIQYKKGSFVEYIKPEQNKKDNSKPF